MLRRIALMLTFAAPAAATPAQAETAQAETGAGGVQTSAGPMRITPVVTGLTEPWGVDFLPGGQIVITEREGRLLLIEEGVPRAVGGLPAVFADGQGGLLDVMIPRDFATSREVWLTYAAPVGQGAATAVGKGRLSADMSVLEGFVTLYSGDEAAGGRHFGARLVEAGDGSVFVTTGDRGTGPEGMASQDMGRAEGKVIHLDRAGLPATVLPGARPGVFSSGHRNAQGAAMGPDGALWLVEHGAQGGDEVNRVQAGRNYGWPVISYGVNYNGDVLGVGQAQPGMEQPVHYWDPSIAPSGLMFYDGDLIPEWRGDLFTGSLNSDFISRLDPEAGFAEERIAAAQTGRVRDMVQGPDGALWFLSVADGVLYRMGPVR